MTTYRILYIFLFSLSLFFLIFNFIHDSGYWFDEWSTLFNVDPNITFEQSLNRIKGFEEGSEREITPPIYFLTLKLFFLIFGYSTENGRLFSIIFFLLSILLIYFICKLTIKKDLHLIATSIVATNPFLLWMANETRIDMFLLFISILNIFFFLVYLQKRNNFIFIILFFFNLLTLSVYPLTLSIIVAQIFYLIFDNFINKKKDYYNSLIILISILLYILINFEYLFGKTAPAIIQNHSHYATLTYKFFITFFFNTFFATIFFGFIFASIIIYFLFSYFKLNLYNNYLRFFSLVIFFSFLQIIISSLFYIPVVSPRYIIFVIPLILLWIIIHISLSLNTKFLITVISIICVVNLIFNYDKKPIKKPPTSFALEIINSNNEQSIYLLPDVPLFTNYVQHKKIFVKRNFKLINKYLDKKEVDFINSFALLCLNNPRYHYGKKELSDNISCLKNFIGYEQYKVVNIPDYKIVFFNKR